MSAQNNANTWFARCLEGIRAGSPSLSAFTQILNYGPINHIEQAGNAFTGTNYGTVIQNSGEDAYWLDSLALKLKISPKADYGYYPSGEEGNLRRGGCTPGTRVGVIEGVARWACDTSPDSENIFWLSGQGGAGKTTIAHTIADLFAHNSTGGTTLGGSFFCSRHSPETRAASAVVRTIVYRLALKSPSFRAALKLHGDFETVDRGPRSQFEALLVKPWQESAHHRQANNEPCYVIPIDALDELDAEGGTEFLATLITIVKEHDLSGLKFFVTSRLEPALVERVESFDKKQVCRLEKIPLHESSADIKLYLQASIVWATDGDIGHLVADAAGLFIYAATVVEYLRGRNTGQQQNLLHRILTIPHSHNHPRGVTTKLDDLYGHILETSLVDRRDLKDPIIPNQCLAILHTFLCTVERTSTTVAVGLLEGANSNNEVPLHVTDADGLLGRMHAVLYSHDGQVLWFHKSFLDFMFDEERSQSFFCDQAQHHRTLSTGCFEIMRRGLRFNIANITTSYRLDCDNPTLAESIKTNISATLSYACRLWSGHLSLTHPAIIDPLLDALQDFLPLRILFWMEAMNLMKQRGHCERMLLGARKWVNAFKSPSNIVGDLEEAAAFAFYFSTNGAAQSTPHLYISSLATFPRDSTLRKRWRQHFPGIPSFVNARSTAGGALLSMTFKSEVNAVAVSTDGMQIALGLGDGSVRVLGLADGEELKCLEGHTDSVNSVGYSPDGKHIVSGSNDTSLRVWDISTGEQLKRLRSHTESVTSVAYSPDGKQIVSGSYDRSLRLWDVSTGEQLKCLWGHSQWVTSVVFSPDGKHIVSGSDCSLRVWDATTGKQLKCLEGHTQVVTCLAYSPDGKHIISGSYDESLRVWDAATGEQLKCLEGHTSLVDTVAYSPDGKHIISGSHDNSLRVWDAPTGKQLACLEGHTSLVSSVRYSPDSKRIISGSWDKSLRVWDMAAWEQLKCNEGHISQVTSAAYSPDSKHISSGSWDQSLRVWDVSTGEELRCLQGHTGCVNSVVYSPDGKCVASGSSDNSLRVWDTSTGEQLKCHEGHTSPVTSAAYSSDGKHIASGSHDQSVRVWDVSTGEELKCLQGHRDWVHSVAYSPDGKHIVSGSSDGSLRVWDVSTGEELKRLEGHTNGVYSVVYSPDGKHIVSGSGDGSLRVWDVFTGEQLKYLEGHTRWVNSVAYSPDGTCIVSGSGDRSLRVWDASTGEQLECLEGHTGAVASVSYSPDGKYIVSGSADKSLRIWDPSKQHSNRNWYIRHQQGEHTGWLVSPTDLSAHLMLIPLMEGLPGDTNVLTMPTSLVPHLDISKARLGDTWTQCYTPMG